MSNDRKTWPILTIAGVLLPAILVGIAFRPSTGSVSSGGWGLGEIFIFVLLIVGGAALGAISSALALLRREPWRPLQVIALLASAGFLLYFGVLFARDRPQPSLPMGEPAFLTLAPARERVRPQAIVLAYPAPSSSEAASGYVIGLRDSLGVVTSLRAAELSAPLKPGEVRLQLDAVDGRWSMRRNADHIRDLPDEKWRLGAYLEIRVTSVGWGVPVGIADGELRPVDDSRR